MGRIQHLNTERPKTRIGRAPTYRRANPIGSSTSNISFWNVDRVVSYAEDIISFILQERMIGRYRLTLQDEKENRMGKFVTKYPFRACLTVTNETVERLSNSPFLSSPQIANQKVRKVLCLAWSR